VPAIAGLVVALRSDRVLRALGEELGTTRNGTGGVAVDVWEEAGGARIRVRAPHPAVAMAACRAYVRIAEAETGREDQVERWLVAEVADIEHALAELDRELAVLPALSPSGPEARDEVLVRARVRRMEAEAADRAGGGEASSSILAALRRLAVEARWREHEAAARGPGSAHPEMKAAAERARWLEGRIAAQRANEVEAAAVLEAAMTALPKRADRATVARALGVRLRGVDVEHATSLDPIPLQILAVEAAMLDAEEHELAARYGPAHPERAALRGRLSALQTSFASERDTLAARIDAGVAGGDHDARPDRLREEAARLATILARLAHWRETSRPARLRVRAGCAVVAG
jgi:hypothetical protein